MTMAVVPSMPDRETKAAPTPRGQDRAALADAFGRQVLQVEKEAVKAPSEPDEEPLAAKPEEAELPVDRPRSSQTSGEAMKPAADRLAREVLDLLAARGPKGENASQTETPAVPPADDVAGSADEPASIPSVAQAIVAAVSNLVQARDAVRPDAEGISARQEIAGPLQSATTTASDIDPERASGVQTDPAKSANVADVSEDVAISPALPRSPQGTEAATQDIRGRARLEILRQETHFEPTMREAVLVEAQTARAESWPTVERDLRRILADRPDPAGIASADVAPDAPPEARSAQPETGRRSVVAPPGQEPAQAPSRAAGEAEPSPAAGRNPVVAQTVAPMEVGSESAPAGDPRTEVDRLDGRRAMPTGVPVETNSPMPTAGVGPAPEPKGEAGARLPIRYPEQGVTSASTPIGPSESRGPTSPEPVSGEGGEDRSAPTPNAAGAVVEPAGERRSNGETARGRGEGGERTLPARMPDIGSAAPLTSAAPAGAVPAVVAQVAERIVDAFAGQRPDDRPFGTPSAEAHLRLRAGGAALKTLTIQLQPEHLGTLHISMRLNEGELQIEMAASRAETARMLSEDRSSLKTLLESAGFTVEDAAITVVAREASTGQPSIPNGRDPEPSGGRGFERSSDQGMAGDRREQRSRDDGHGGAPSADAPAGRSSAGSAGNRAGSVFL